jgi:hypothetical protein
MTNPQSNDLAAIDLYFICCHGSRTFRLRADFFSFYLKNIKPVKSTLLIGDWDLGFHWTLGFGI